MKKAFVLLFVFAATTVFAQTKKFSAGISVMPLWSDFIISSDGTTPDVILQVTKETTKGRLGFNALAMGEYQIKKRLSLRIGLGYSQTGYGPKKIDDIRWSQPAPSEPTAIKINHINSDVIIPVVLKLHFKRKPNWYGLIGGSSIIMIARATKTTKWFSDGRVETSKMDVGGTENYRKINSSGIIGGGYEFHLTPKAHLFLEPTFTCNIGTLVKDVPFAYRTFTAGLNTGIRF